MDFTSETITTYSLDLSLDDIDESAIRAAKNLVFDSIGCCLGAYSSPPSKHLRRVYGDLDGPERATVIGDGGKTLIEYAGFINAAMVRYLDFNDAYISEGRACHPSDHIPALISIAENVEASGKALLEAIVVAYEIEGMGLDTGVTWDPGYDYVTWGAYSSVASVGKLMGLSAREMINALGIVGSSNLTLAIARRGNVSMWKGVAHPYVTHNAIQACQMAKAGLTGPGQVFEGPDGFWDVAANGELSVDKLGGRDDATYRITNAHIKPYPCGYYMQPIIAGIVDLVEDRNIDPEHVAEIRIRTFEQAATVLAGEEKWSTDLTRESADHSIPYTAAIAFLYGDISPAHYGRSYRNDPSVHQLMAKVTVEESSELNDQIRKYPSSTPSTVQIDTESEIYETQVDYAPGHAENPLSQEELERKFRGMVEPLLMEDQIVRIRDLSQDLENLDTVDGLINQTII